MYIWDRDLEAASYLDVAEGDFSMFHADAWELDEAEYENWGSSDYLGNYEDENGKEHWYSDEDEDWPEPDLSKDIDG